jgi:hypothetical protein
MKHYVIREWQEVGCGVGMNKDNNSNEVDKKSIFKNKANPEIRDIHVELVFPDIVNIEELKKLQCLLMTNTSKVGKK